MWILHIYASLHCLSPTISLVMRLIECISSWTLIQHTRFTLIAKTILQLSFKLKLRRLLMRRISAIICGGRAGRQGS
jgi:hypothetical protein